MHRSPRFLFSASPVPLASAFIAAVLFVLSCSSASKVSGGEEFEGWRKKDNIDYFYMRIGGSASQVAKESGEETRMRSTCIESTKLQAKDTIIRKVVGEIISAVSATADAETKNHVIISMRKAEIRGTELKECAKRSSKWATCECVHFVKGRNLRRQWRLQVEKLAKKSGI